MSRFVPTPGKDETYTGGDEIGGLRLVRCDINAVVPTSRITFITVNYPTAATPTPAKAVAEASIPESVESNRKGWDCDF
jgi:hypothetical protein